MASPAITHVLSPPSLHLRSIHEHARSVGVDLEQGAVWHALRQTGVGGSDMASVVGRSRFKSREELLASKLENPAISEANAACRVGHWLEPYILERVGARPAAHLGTLASHRANYLLANLDGLRPAPGGGLELIEIKTTSMSSARYMRAEAPIHYQLQVQHYLGVTGIQQATLYGLVIQEDRDELMRAHDAASPEDRATLGRSIVAKSELIEHTIRAKPKWIERMHDIAHDFWVQVRQERASVIQSAWKGAPASQRVHTALDRIEERGFDVSARVLRPDCSQHVQVLGTSSHPSLCVGFAPDTNALIEFERGGQLRDGDWVSLDVEQLRYARIDGPHVRIGELENECSRDMER